MTAANKAKMDRYRLVREQKKKVQKMLLERVEKRLFEQFGTTAEEREAAGKAMRQGHQLRKKHQNKNLLDGKNKDETSSSVPEPEYDIVVEKADSIQPSIDGTELGLDTQYGLHGNGNTVSINGNGFAEGPAIDDGNTIYSTESSTREDMYMYPSQDEQLNDLSSHEVPLDPILTEEGMQDYSVAVAGSYNAAALQTNTSLTRTILHNVLCSPITGPLVLITAFVSIMIRIIIAVV